MEPGVADARVIERTFRAGARELHDARVSLGTALARQGVAGAHHDDVVAVVNELLAAARECGVTAPLGVTVVVYPLLTSVRVRCDRNVELRDKPFDVRERLIHRLAIASGRRRRDDGSVDLWAEIARPRVSDVR